MVSQLTPAAIGVRLFGLLIPLDREEEMSGCQHRSR